MTDPLTFALVFIVAIALLAVGLALGWLALRSARDSEERLYTIAVNERLNRYRKQ